MNRDIIRKSNRIFPWFGGLSADLLFFVAIDTLWLTVVKHLNAGELVSLTTVSLVVCIILQTPILKLIHHIGNTKSTRLGTALLLLSSLLLTFGPSYVWLLVGKTVFELALSFKNMDSALLKNNLSLLHLEDEEFIKIKNQANTVYSVITAVIAFTVAYLFNYNHYYPMYLCIFFCMVTTVLCFFVRDFSENSRRKHIHDSRAKLPINTFLVFAIGSYAIFYPLLDSGQNNGKLFIQQELLLNYDVALTASYLTFIVAISRVVRIISNLTFSKIYLRFKDKVGIALSLGLFLAVSLMFSGYFITGVPIVKFSVMGFGYVIFLAIRDPFRTYLQELVLTKTDRDDQQSALIYMEMFRKIGAAVFNIIVTAMLFKIPMIYVIALTLVFSILEVLISIKLYRIVNEQ